MKIQQFVMAYGVEQDRLRAMMPENLASLRPVVRINAEIRDGQTACLECNVPVERPGFRGWLNVAHWENVPFRLQGKTVVFCPDFLEISFTGVGIQGGCPAEKDNQGTLFLNETPSLRPPESISENKEFCDCRFRWRFGPDNAGGVSLGKTLPASPTPPRVAYPPQPLTPENVAKIPCLQVLGTYQVSFTR